MAKENTNAMFVELAIPGQLLTKGVDLTALTILVNRPIAFLALP